jgi:hypothetical protein
MGRPPPAVGQQLESLQFGQAAPDPVGLTGTEGEVQALGPDRAPRADRFGRRSLVGRRAGHRHGKEQIGIAGLAGGSGPPVRFRSRSIHAMSLGGDRMSGHHTIRVISARMIQR